MSYFFVSFSVLTIWFSIIAALERVRRLQYVPRPKSRAWVETDIAWYLVAALSAGLSTFLLRPVLTRLALPGVSMLSATLPGWCSLLAAVVLFDGLYFTVHRGLHRSDVLWTFHKVHHSSRHLDVLATTRTHAVEHLVRNVPAQVVLFTLGFAPTTIAVAVLILGGFGALNHSNLRLPFQRLEWILVTPRLHRIHHGSSSSQNNYATIFTIWDRALGSLLQGDTPPDGILGVPGEVDTYPQRFQTAFGEPRRQLRSSRSTAASPTLIEESC